MKKIISIVISFLCCCPCVGFSQSNVIFTDKDTVYTFTEKMPEFPGGPTVLQNYIAKNTDYPREEQANGIQGIVYVNFIVEKDGTISDVHAIKEVPCGPGLTKEAIRVISEMPRWIPANLDGKIVSVSMIQPIKFLIDEDYGNYGRRLSPHDEGNVWGCNPGILPEIIGGDTALKNYVAANFSLTKKETKHCKGYSMAFTMVIDTDGTICDLHIISIVSQENVVPKIATLLMGMPKWKPGRSPLEKVRVRMKGQLVIASPAKNSRIYFQELEALPPQLDYFIAPPVLPKNQTVLPSYVGGDSAMQIFLKKNTVYPPSLKGKGGEQKIEVSFIVENDGSLSYVEIYNEPVCPQEFKDEAIRVVTSMPKWTAGTINGRSARFVMKVEVNFLP